VNLKYRAEIDGLRALAVIPVILFHAEFELFSGGFVGVDVFFVISGYLITTILIEDIENERFSIVNFYERRARRILPALFFVMLVCIPISIIYLPADEFRDFFQSIVAVSLFASNILFWKEGGYFDSEASDKPLLHTWSLAVEEQYYILFPIFLILVWRFGKNRVFWMIVVMATISLLLSEWGWRNKANANFYLAPTRAWELFAGSIAAFIVQKQGVQKNNPLALLGSAVIMFSIFFYDEVTPFPSVYTLVPVGGVFLLILYADRRTVTAKILSIKPFVGLGLISYSAYLVHQPLLVFTNLASLEGVSVLTKAIAICAIFLVAWFMWRYVETPFRKAVNQGSQVLIASALFLSAFIVLGGLYHYKVIPQKAPILTWGGKSHAAPEKLGGIELEGENCSAREPSKSCIVGSLSPKVVIVGDSHARVLMQAAYKALAQDSFTLVDMSATGCPFLIGLNTFSNGNQIEECDADYQQKRIEFISTLTPSTIVLHARLPLYLHGDGFDNSIGGVEPIRSYYVGVSGEESYEERTNMFTNAFVDTISQIVNADHKVVIISPVPTNGWHPVKRLMRLSAIGNDPSIDYVRTKMAIPRGAVELRQADVNSILEGLTEKFAAVRVIDSLEILCDPHHCHSISESGEILYADRDHLSTFGANVLFNEFMNYLRTNE
jgi:peptidoglycan/LPS O-acetylase OafA/YrhL